jgi:hypothetical protein
MIWKKFATGFALSLSCCCTSWPAGSQTVGYQSPYALAFAVPVEQLLAADYSFPRNDFRQESEIPYEEWYSESTRQRYRSWGPKPRQYPPLPQSGKMDGAWMRQRLLAVAQRMIGLPYQHHHIPDWEPPSDWPWKQVAFGGQSKGLDCSNFTSWLYNYGLGIKLRTKVDEQAAAVEIPGPGGTGTILAEVIYDDSGYDGLVRKLRAGDLLYIKNRQGEISHVVVWVGEYGRAPDGAPLIVDCTDTERRDCNGNAIPQGVQLRPFLPNCWYYRSFSHAHRIIQ